MNSKVEKRHKLFAQEYVIDFNGRRAAIAAGYGETRAEVTASELLKVPRVMALIDNLQSQRASKLELKREQVVEELRNIAFSNMLDYMTPHKDGRAAARLLESNTRAGRSNSGSKTRQPQGFHRQRSNPHDLEARRQIESA
jgi:phage terminase small subunit